MTLSKPWERNIVSMQKHIDEFGYKDILREPTIIGTMFTGEGETTIAEYRELVKNRNWDSCYKKAIVDDGKGNPERFSYYPESSGNFIHCAYHLAQYELHHSVSIKDLDFIIEVGCGYGAMSKVCRQAGFKGKYILFDLSVFSKIQEYYLDDPDNIYITDIEELKKISFETNKTMFISTWAASEMPIDYREELLTIAVRQKHILLAYQCFFENEDVEQYFKEWKEKYTCYSWTLINAMDTNHRYLFGTYYYE